MFLLIVERYLQKRLKTFETCGKIGNNCVVGAGAVVSGYFEDNCVIAGNPAKIIKRV